MSKRSFTETNESGGSSPAKKQAASVESVGAHHFSAAKKIQSWVRSVLLQWKTPKVPSAVSHRGPGDTSTIRRTLLTNEELAHELVLDPTFRILDSGYVEEEEDEEDEDSKTVDRAVSDAYWDALVMDLCLEPTPCYVRVLGVIHEIKTELLAMFNRMASSYQIFVAPLVGSGDVDTERWEDDSKAMLGRLVAVIQRAQAPKREGEMARQWAMHEAALSKEGTLRECSEAFCQALRFVMEQMSLLRTDTANTTLRRIEPVIRKHGASYEFAHMERRIRTNPGGVGVALARTQAWLNEVVPAALVQGVVTRSSLADAATRGVGVQRLHQFAVMSLIVDSDVALPLSREMVPECLLLDFVTLRRAQCEFHAMVHLNAFVRALQQTEATKDMMATVGGIDGMQTFVRGFRAAALRQPAKVWRARMVDGMVAALRHEDVVGPEDEDTIRRVFEEHIRVDGTGVTVNQERASAQRAWVHAVFETELGAGTGPANVLREHTKVRPIAERLRKAIAFNFRVYGRNHYLKLIMSVATHAHE